MAKQQVDELVGPTRHTVDFQPYDERKLEECIDMTGMKMIDVFREAIRNFHRYLVDKKEKEERRKKADQKKLSKVLQDL